MYSMNCNATANYKFAKHLKQRHIAHSQYTASSVETKEFACMPQKWLAVYATG